MIGDDNNAPPKVRNAAAAAKNLKKKGGAYTMMVYTLWILNRTIRQLAARHGEITQNWFMANMYAW